MVICQQHEKLFGNVDDLPVKAEGQGLRENEEFLQPFYEATLEE